MSSTWKLRIGPSTFAKLSADLERYFVRRLNDEIDPEDLVGEVWLDGRRYRGAAPLGHYLFMIARSKVAEHLRLRTRRPRLSFEASDAWSLDDRQALESSIETLFDREQRAVIVRECIAEVEPPHDEVIALWILEDMDPLEIATELRISYNTTRSRLHRGKRQLEAALRRRLDSDES